MRTLSIVCAGLALSFFACSSSNPVADGGGAIDARGVGDAPAGGDGGTSDGPSGDAAAPGCATEIELGGRHGCAIVSGALFCWGENYMSGKLGNGTSSANHSTAQRVLGVGGTGTLADVVEVSAGNEHTCARTSDGKLYCFGDNAYGALGNGSHGNGAQTPVATPVEVTALGTDVAQVSAGHSFTCARKTSNNSVWCWGYNFYGELGSTTSTDCNPGSSTIPCEVAPIQVTLPRPALQVAAFEAHVCAVLDDHSLYCWGLNHAGQVGTTPDPMNGVAPRQIAELGTDVAEVAVGYLNTCARKISDSSVWCWGANRSGQLGMMQDNPVYLTAPTQITALGAVAKVLVGNEHICARKSDNTIYCLGNGAVGQLGNATTTGDNSMTPVQLVAPGPHDGWTEAHALGVGYNFGCTLDEAARIYCWGENLFYQLGSTGGTACGPGNCSSVPIRVNLSCP